MYAAIHVSCTDSELGLSLGEGTLPFMALEETLLGKEERGYGRQVV